MAFCADLSELKPVNGFIKGQAFSSQLNKPSTANAPVIKPTANAETSAKPMQQLQTAAAVRPLQFELNSQAIKLANNPLTNLAGLQEAAAAVLDEPVRSAAFSGHASCESCMASPSKLGKCV